MPTAVAEAVQQKTKAYAVSIEKELGGLFNESGPKWWREAELIDIVEEKSLWEILGHESVSSFREYLWIGRSSWYERRRVWRDFAKPCLEKDCLTRAKLNRMSSQNAKQLCRLPEKQRFSSKWIEWALGLHESELEAKVDHILENDTEPEEGLGKPESQAILKLHCTTSQKTFIQETFVAFADHVNDGDDGPKLNPVDDAGRICELICAEVRSGL